ncbi:MAG: GAF domain-containing protein [Candidatus Eremiobacteraeota bacterium]|nr:GAF domain-containing protein [Candidatus Eremiobacteraeota bacterium]
MPDVTVAARDARWKWPLWTICAIALIVTILALFDNVGFFATPWYGFWDDNLVPGAPFTMVVAGVVPGGAAARAGFQIGDRIDLREQSLEARIAAVDQPVGGRPTAFTIHRGSATLQRTLVASSVWQGAIWWKLPNLLSWGLAFVWLAACAALVAARRWWRADARLLALVLVCVSSRALDATFSATPNADFTVARDLVSRICIVVAAWLLLRLCAAHGVRTPLRSAIEVAAYVAIPVALLTAFALPFGMLTLRIDPLPYQFRNNGIASMVDVVLLALVAAAAVAAVATSPPTQRPRIGWLLLPLPIATLSATIVAEVIWFGLTTSWFAAVFVNGIGGLILLLGALLVTYALLKQRVLDFEFVLSRTLVFAIVSAIVVASFALLEWLLGTVLAGVSHATGVFANATLALVLGVSISYIQKRVDAFVDAVFFRKRRDDERALREYSKEAAYVTDPEVLLDQALEKVRLHTDARSAALLFDGDGRYSTQRSFGEAAKADVSENDGAILALKTWHKPLDPHRCDTELQGALLLPMLARGRLLGVVVLGERAGGEAYAPDEVEALAQFAQGVGSALDVLGTKTDSSIVTALGRIESLLESLTVRAREA